MTRAVEAVKEAAERGRGTVLARPALLAKGALGVCVCESLPGGVVDTPALPQPAGPPTSFPALGTPQPALSTCTILCQAQTALCKRSGSLFDQPFFSHSPKPLSPPSTLVKGSPALRTSPRCLIAFCNLLIRRFSKSQAGMASNTISRIRI